MPGQQAQHRGAPLVSEWDACLKSRGHQCCLSRGWGGGDGCEVFSITPRHKLLQGRGNLQGAGVSKMQSGVKRVISIGNGDWQWSYLHIGSEQILTYTSMIIIYQEKRKEDKIVSARRSPRNLLPIKSLVGKQEMRWQLLVEIQHPKQYLWL